MLQTVKQNQPPSTSDTFQLGSLPNLEAREDLQAHTDGAPPAWEPQKCLANLSVHSGLSLGLSCLACVWAGLACLTGRPVHSVTFVTFG
jgi:hypothetical protein